MTDTRDNAETSDAYVKDQLAFLRYAEHYQYLTVERQELIDGYAAALTHWRDKAVAEALEVAYQDLHEKHEDAVRRGKEMTSGNRVKWARQNETLGESNARNQGFKSGILTAQAVVARIKLTQENSNGK